MRKPALIITGVVLGLFIVAGVLWVPGYDRAGVHPELLAIKEPVGSVKVYNYFDGGTLGLEIVDAQDKSFAFFLTMDRRGKAGSYPEFAAGYPDAFGEGGLASYPCSVDSRRFFAALVANHAELGYERNVWLERLRHTPLDIFRRWWFEKSYIK